MVGTYRYRLCITVVKINRLKSASNIGKLSYFHPVQPRIFIEYPIGHLFIGMATICTVQSILLNSKIKISSPKRITAKKDSPTSINTIHSTLCSHTQFIVISDIIAPPSICCSFDRITTQLHTIVGCRKGESSRSNRIITICTPIPVFITLYHNIP